MSNANDVHNTKHHTASNWNILRSKVVPSSVSGSHKTALPMDSSAVVRSQTSDETLTIKARKAPAFYESVNLPSTKP